MSWLRLALLPIAGTCVAAVAMWTWMFQLGSGEPAHLVYAFFMCLIGLLAVAAGWRVERHPGARPSGPAFAGALVVWCGMLAFTVVPIVWLAADNKWRVDSADRQIGGIMLLCSIGLLPVGGVLGWLGSKLSTYVRVRNAT